VKVPRFLFREKTYDDFVGSTIRFHHNYSSISNALAVFSRRRKFRKTLLSPPDHLHPLFTAPFIAIFESSDIGPPFSVADGGGFILGLVIARYTDLWKAQKGRLKHVLVATTFGSGLFFLVMCFWCVTRSGG
jgi:hypothetical protein